MSGFQTFLKQHLLISLSHWSGQCHLFILTQFIWPHELCSSIEQTASFSCFAIHITPNSMAASNAMAKMFKSKILMMIHILILSIWKYKCLCAQHVNVCKCINHMLPHYHTFDYILFSSEWSAKIRTNKQTTQQQ